MVERSFFGEAVDVAYSPVWTKDNVSLAASANFGHFLRLIYENLTQAEPSGILMEHKLDTTLRILGLQDSQKMVNENCKNNLGIYSLVDFEHKLGRSYCRNKCLPYKKARNYSMERICDMILSNPTANGEICNRRMKKLKKCSSAHSRVTFGRNFEDRRVVNEETEKLKHLVAELTEALQTVEAKNIALRVQLMEKREPLQKSTSQGCILGRQGQREEYLERELLQLRKTLQGLKQKLHSLPQPLLALPLPPQPLLMTTSSYSYLESASLRSMDKSVGEDSGWVSEEDLRVSSSTPSHSPKHNIEYESGNENSDVSVHYTLRNTMRSATMEPGEDGPALRETRQNLSHSHSFNVHSSCSSPTPTLCSNTTVSRRRPSTWTELEYLKEQTRSHKTNVGNHRQNSTLFSSTGGPLAAICGEREMEEKGMRKEGMLERSAKPTSSNSFTQNQQPGMFPSTQNQQKGPTAYVQKIPIMEGGRERERVIEMRRKLASLSEKLLQTQTKLTKAIRFSLPTPPHTTTTSTSTLTHTTTTSTTPSAEPSAQNHTC